MLVCHVVSLFANLGDCLLVPLMAGDDFGSHALSYLNSLQFGLDPYPESLSVCSGHGCAMLSWMVNCSSFLYSLFFFPGVNCLIFHLSTFLWASEKCSHTFNFVKCFLFPVFTTQPCQLISGPPELPGHPGWARVLGLGSRVKASFCVYLLMAVVDTLPVPSQWFVGGRLWERAHSATTRKEQVRPGLASRLQVISVWKLSPQYLLVFIVAVEKSNLILNPWRYPRS